jgi:hypothetical protein
LLATLVYAETDRGEDLRVKTLRRFAIFYPEIDVIEKTRAHDLSFGLSEHYVRPHWIDDDNLMEVDK